MACTRRNTERLVYTSLVRTYTRYRSRTAHILPCCRVRRHIRPPARRAQNLAEHGSMDCSRQAHRWNHWYVYSPTPPFTSCAHEIIPDDSLLQSKANKDVMQPLSKRIAITRHFLELFKPGPEYYIVPITDVAGPTGWDPNVQALVVSKETLSGAAASKSAFITPADRVLAGWDLTDAFMCIQSRSCAKRNRSRLSRHLSLTSSRIRNPS